jgi:hypothetical protein
MKTHCAKGHDMLGRKRCQTCNRECKRAIMARKLGDGLTPQERLQKVRKGWAWAPNYLRGNG